MKHENYLDIDFGMPEHVGGKEMIHIDGYVYFCEDADANGEDPYRHVQFCDVYIPVEKIGDRDYIDHVEELAKQYIDDISEEEADARIQSYLDDGYIAIPPKQVIQKTGSDTPVPGHNKTDDKENDRPLYLLIVGSRTFSDRGLLFEKADEAVGGRKNVTIVSGGAKGADTLAEQYADSRGFEKKIFPAKWDLFGKQAGYIRNREMHKFLSDKEDRMCLAFWNGVSRGTKHNFELAEEFGTPLVVVRFTEGETK